ncbi:WD repeat-containing protein 18 [Chamberlinius hualienensis]
MENKSELLVTSDSKGLTWNCCVWDYTNGTTLRSFKPGISVEKTLNLVGNEYFISADYAKPIINVWSLLNKGQNQHTKFVTPGLVNAAVLTPDSTFCIAAIEDKLFIWQICNGELINVVKHHFNQITTVKVTDDGSQVISAAEDNYVCVWKLSSLLKISENSTDRICPLYSWSDSSLPVTGVHVGNGGRKARVATVSLDHTCRLYTLKTGDLLLSVVFDVSLTSVVMDPAEFFIFVGGNDGSIFAINLVEPPPSVKWHMSGPETVSNVFVGHTKKITALTVTSNGQNLISGSEDSQVKVWDIPSKNCLRNLSHKGSITNVLLIPALSVLTLNSLPCKHTFCVERFQHNLSSSDNWQHKATIYVGKNLETPTKLNSTVEFAKSLQKEESGNTLVNEIEELKKISNDLYRKSVADLLHT